MKENKNEKPKQAIALSYNPEEDAPKVIASGKGALAERIIEKAKETQADVIALSALMTTTMERMKEVVELKTAAGLSAKVIIGGAVTTEEYAREIGADGYAKDAQEAVKVAISLTE